MNSTFIKHLARLCTAMPKSIRFPYGEGAYGLTTYSSIPKYGRKVCAVKNVASRFEAQLAASDATATAKIWS